MTTEEIKRYSRQTAVAEIGETGQRRLAASRVFIAGIGGLGGLVSAELAGAGVGDIAFADCGPVEISNLHRQMLYRTLDIGNLKTDIAAETLRALNPHVRITPYEQFLDEAAMRKIFKGFSVVVDCSDNFRTRAAINRICEELKIPCVYGAVYAFEGQASVFMHDGKTPCLECLFPDIGSCADTKCTENGVVGPCASMIASVQAAEAMKIIMGLPSLAGRVLMADMLNNNFTVIPLRKRERCSICIGK